MTEIAFFSSEFATFKNYTPHAITIVKTEDGQDICIPSHGCARLRSEPQQKLGEIDGVSIVSAQKFFGLDLQHSPDLNNDTSPILVSMPVGEFIANNPEVYAGSVYGPDTSPTGVVRNEKGEIVGTRRLIRYK